MNQIPSFDDQQALESAVRSTLESKYGEDQALLSRLTDFVVTALMSDAIRMRGHRLRRHRDFDKLIKHILDPIYAKRDRLCSRARGYAQRRYAKHDLQYIDELVHCVAQKLMSARGVEHLLTDHDKIFHDRAFQWWMSNELEKLKRSSYRTEVVKQPTAQAELGPHSDATDSTQSHSEASPDHSKPKKRVVFQVSFESAIKREDSEEGEDQRGIFDQVGDSQQLDQLIALIQGESERENTHQTLRHILSLSPAMSSALIARAWPYLHPHCESKEQLANELQSPLSTTERIILLDAEEDAQLRMVRVAFPSLTEDIELRQKLPTLNRASNRALDALEALRREERSDD